MPSLYEIHVRAIEGYVDIRAAVACAMVLLSVGPNPAISQSSGWQNMNNADVGGVMAIARNSQGQIFAGGNGIFRSTDNGNTWQQMIDGMGSISVRSLVIDTIADIFAGTSNGVFRTTNNGDSWAQRGLPGVSVSSFCIAGSNDMYAGTEYHGIYRSTDKGISWLHVDSALSNTIIYSLAVTVSGSVLAGTAGFGLYISTDHGMSWLSKNNGMPSYPSVSALAIKDNGHIFAGTYGSSGGGMLRSTDDGASWTQLPTGLPGGPFVYAVGIDPFGDLLFGSNAMFAKSTDEGSSWETLSVGPVDARVSSIAFGGGATILAGTDGSSMETGIFRSDDSGNSWVWLHKGLVFPKIIPVIAGNSLGHIFIGAYSDEVLRSTDLGLSWTSLNISFPATDTYISSLVINSANHVFVGSDKGIMRSTDNGESWLEVNNGLTNTYVRALVADTGGYLLASTQEGGVFRSTNNGANWTNVWNCQDSIVSCFAFNGRNQIFAGMAYPGSGLFRSTDRGLSWFQTGLTYRIGCLAVTPGDRLFAATDMFGLWRSTDDGITWDQSNVGLATSQLTAIVANSEGHIFLGTYDKSIYRSTDGGVLWTQFSDGLSSYEILSLYAAPNGYVYAGVTGFGIARTFEPTSGVEAIPTPIPRTFSLSQNYPNPFNPSTTIRYGLPNRLHVSLTVFNALGQAVATLVHDVQDAGYHQVKFDATHLSSGVYFYRMEVRALESAIGRDSKSGAGSDVQTRKLLVIR